ncbi:MAG: bacteriohemerythrin [Halieaceae bacterium]|nr:bacteriohemerythrin [Halieaceae bacterium]
MQSFEWDEVYDTGIELVDEQHKVLVTLINELGTACAEDTADESEISSVVEKVLSYTDYHFGEEQELMLNSGLAPQHVDKHFEEHRKFVDGIAFLYNAGSSSPRSAQRLFDFLTHWLAYHILGSDQNMARQIHAIRAGADPAEAFAREERGVDKSTEPLLHALSALLDQITERNRELIVLNQSLEDKVQARTVELSAANRKLEEMALTDALTDLPNRRAAMRHLEELWSDPDQRLSCMMLDADNFKIVNDRHGHDAGDLVLQTLSAELRSQLDEKDFVGRLGGDEFIIFCPSTSLEDALRRAEELLSSIQQLRVPTGDSHWVGSLSIGVAERDGRMSDHHDLMKRADLAVYEAKRGGRNQVAARSPAAAAMLSPVSAQA